MLMTITLHHPQASDLGYLLYKHPERIQHFDLAFGQVHLFYPEVSDTRCQCALLLDVDPIKLSRRQSTQQAPHALYPYVNDRPYVCSSFLSVAISRILGSALSGSCKERPELAQQALDFEVEIAALPCRGGERAVREVFEPLGYSVTVEGAPLDEQFEDWGQSRYFNVGLRANVRLTDLLSHLYVLVPALDSQKHYYVGRDEVEKLLRHGEGWLGEHPQKERIALRYLDHRRALVRAAMEKLIVLDDEELDDATMDAQKDALEKPLSLHKQRLNFVRDTLVEHHASKVLDLGCGEGKLIKLLLKAPGVKQVLGIDVSWRSLEIASRRLGLSRMSERERARVEVRQGSLLYRDKSLRDWDAAALVEVIEHVEEERLGHLANYLFGDAQPGVVVITTPNSEYNALFESLPSGKFRHGDHRFEWTRQQFKDWSDAVATQHQYDVTYHPLGEVDEMYGAPSQAAVFVKRTPPQEDLIKEAV